MPHSAYQQAHTTGASTARALRNAAHVDAVTVGVATVTQPDTGRAAYDSATVAAGDERPVQQMGQTARDRVARGLTTVAAPTALRDAIQFRALAAANRFRVIRTFDVAAICFPERPYKAALTAAQRAMRRLVRDGFLRRYVTDRHQHVYGLTQRGAQWLEAHNVSAASSVRRVSDMTNPEHLLWASFIVSCCEARGVRASTEAELLVALNQGRAEDQPVVQGLLDVSWVVDDRDVWRLLRPDAVGYEPDGVTWFEIDRSKRGRQREQCLEALFKRVGAQLRDGHDLRRVVVFAKTERIRARALALARKLLLDPGELRHGPRGERALVEVDDGVFEAWGEVDVRLRDGRTMVKTKLRGHVIVELLPTWLPKVRIDNRAQYSTAGWFAENYLPYVRPATLGPWPMPESPLLTRT